jgi:anti-anti-sigma factor
MARANEMGTFEVERHADADLIRLFGEHDMATKNQLWDAVARSIESDRGLVVSVSDADFIDSGVIYALFKGDRLLQERGRRLVVHVHTASVVGRALELTNVCESLPCSGDVEAAVVLASTRGSDSSWNIA